jgi:hypothetical protein
MEIRVMENSLGYARLRRQGTGRRKSGTPQHCPRGISKIQKTQIAKDASKRVAREKRRGRVGLLA